MGFSLTEIEGLLTLLSQTSCRKTRAAAATKLELIDERVRELQGLRNELAHLLTECDANDDDLRCPIIERFGQQGPQARELERHRVAGT
jgi:DNA-binding transcriptional MerR regulator